MLVVGLTGSIGMGKSTAALRFRARGIPVFDADAAVHALYAGAAAPLVEAAFPGTTAAGKVERARLAEAVMEDPEAFRRLESIIHPLVEAEERAFLRREAARGAQLAVLEIPLLFETGRDAHVDAVVVVSASAATQRARVLKRPGMTPEKLDGLMARQLGDIEKRRRADFVVDTDVSMEESAAQLDAIIAELRTRQGEAYHRHWA